MSLILVFSYNIKLKNSQEDKDKDVFNQSKKSLSKPIKKSGMATTSPEGPDKKENGVFVYFERKVPATNLTFVMRNLRHFGKYNILVMACRDKEANKDEPECSNQSMKSFQTLRLEHADDIPSGSFGANKLPSNDSTTSIKLSWQEPPQPNGVIVAYQIEYNRVDIPHVS